MRVLFDDELLRRAADETDFHPPRWSPQLLRLYRRRIQFLRSATDERDIRALASLHLEKLRDGRAGTWSIRLDQQFRLILAFRTDGDRRIVVIEVVDYH